VSLDIRWLQQISVLRTSLTVYYRTVYIPGPGGALDPLRTRPNEGRWPTDWTLYTASAPHVAWAEYCRNHPADVEAADVTGGVGVDPVSLASLGLLQVGNPLPPRAIFELSFEFERLADLLSPWGTECISEAGFPLDDFYADGPAYGACPELAAAAEGLGWEAMRVPSAALRDPAAFCVPVFQSGRTRLHDATDVVPTASPTVAVAFATTYADDLRPRWLRLPSR
jgi:RES domain